MLQDDVYKLAKQHLKTVESCCGVDAKFCKNDTWKGDLMQFALAVIALNQWQPIETAPINKPLIVISDNTVQHIIVSFDGEYWGDCSSFEILDGFYPTHWQPLPQLPKQ